MVDLDRIHQRLELLAGYLCELRRLRDLPVAEYLRHEVYAGRYLVQVAAQTCIDLANHVIASEGWRAPRDFGDSFTVLHDQGVIDDALAGRLRGLAGLRNRLVHVYDEIDDTRVHEALATGLPDLDAFATAVARLVS
ncbi:MAG: type VII toxin-antitoxin system HepT family RNase toxin [Pseudonocardiaceae bacterium]